MAGMSTAPLQWYDEPGDRLDVRTLHDILALRGAIFVVEQRCSYLDVDGQDLATTTRHLRALADGEIHAYARMLGPDEHGVAHIGRVIVTPPGRGTGLGHELVDRAMATCRAAWPHAGIALAAQAHLRDFYAGHGFEARGEVYDDAGVDHLDMVWVDQLPE